MYLVLCLLLLELRFQVAVTVMLCLLLLELPKLDICVTGSRGPLVILEATVMECDTKDIRMTPYCFQPTVMEESVTKPWFRYLSLRISHNALVMTQVFSLLCLLHILLWAWSSCFVNCCPEIPSVKCMEAICWNYIRGGSISLIWSIWVIPHERWVIIIFAMSETIEMNRGVASSARLYVLLCHRCCNETWCPFNLFFCSPIFC